MQSTRCKEVQANPCNAKPAKSKKSGRAVTQNQQNACEREGKVKSKQIMRESMQHEALQRQSTQYRVHSNTKLCKATDERKIKTYTRAGSASRDNVNVTSVRARSQQHWFEHCESCLESCVLQKRRRLALDFTTQLSSRHVRRLGRGFYGQTTAGCPWGNERES